MEDGDLVLEVVEAGFEASDSLWGEGNLREENNDVFVEVEGLSGGLEVDFGFS